MCVFFHIPFERDLKLKSCWGYKIYCLKHYKTKHYGSWSSVSSPTRDSDSAFSHTLVHFLVPKPWERGVCYTQLFILTRLGNWLHKIKWLALGHTVTKWQRQDLTQIAWLQHPHSSQGCCGWWAAETKVASCVQLPAFLTAPLCTYLSIFPKMPTPGMSLL